MIPGRSSAALMLLSLSCGARSGLGVSQQEEDAGGLVTPCATPVPPPSPCIAWRAAPAQLIAPPAPPSFGLELGAVIPIPCGALIAWYTIDGVGSAALEWTTRAVAFDGVPLATATAHPSLSAATSASASISLATHDLAVGAIEDNETGCRFLAMNARGHDLGSAVSLGAQPCLAIAASGSDWSFVRASTGVETPMWLERFDPLTAHETLTPLTTPSGQALWDRLVFEDGSFLVDTFREDPTTAIYTDWLQHFDSSGAALTPQIVVEGFTSAPVWLVATGAGALAAWADGALVAVPIDRSGAATGPPQIIVDAKAIYEMTLVPAPGGDVLLAWTELEPTGDLSSYVRALGPDGVPRGPETLLAEHVEASRIYGVVEPGGSRALLAMVREDGIQVLPLTCTAAGH